MLEQNQQQQGELNMSGKNMPVPRERLNEIVTSKKDFVSFKRVKVTSRVYFRDTSKCYWYDPSRVDPTTKEVYDKLKEGDEISFMYIEQQASPQTYTLLYLTKITAYNPAPSFAKAITDVVFGTFGLMPYTALKVKAD